MYGIKACKFCQPFTEIERLAIITISENLHFLKAILYQYDKSFIWQFVHGSGSRFWRLYKFRIITDHV